MLKIGHAVSSETGKTDGTPGNQNGRELRIQDWYNRPWEVYIEPIDRDMGRKAADYVRRIIDCKLYGYSQLRRWSGYKEIMNHQLDVEHGNASDFDCSSLCIAAYIFSGAKLKATGYTRNMARLMEESSQFRVYKDEAHVSSCDHAVAGSMFLSPGHHVAMLLEDGDPLELKEYVHVKGSVRVRLLPIVGSTLYIARNEYLTLVSVDEYSGWYEVYTPKGTGFITCNEKYTEVVER